MTNVSFHLTNALPTTGETGGVYFIKDGRLFVAESENNYVEINPIEVVSTLPTQGIANKLYALEENGNVSLKVWVEGQGYKDTSLPLEDASTTVKGIVQLTNDLNGQSEVLALTQKGANDLNTTLNTHTNNADIHVTATDKTSWNNHLNKVGSATEIGHVKVDGTTITASTDGTISATPPVIPDASKTAKGIVQVGDNINVTGGVVSVPTANNTTYGVVKPDGNTLLFNTEGQLYVKTPQFTIDRYRHTQQLTAGQTTITVDTGIENFYQYYDWQAYDGGMLLLNNQYTLASQGTNLVFTWTAKQYNTTIFILGTRVLQVV